MKKYLFHHTLLCLSVLLLVQQRSIAQSIHFSQYYNAPMLLNPANTALMPENDYRLGINYRNQWASIPVPYNTFSAFADFQAFHKETSDNWLGLGLALFNDKAGNGNLALTRSEGFAAYHLGIKDQNMISVGLSGGYTQRSVDFSKLTFDTQWDGFTFNPTLFNGEKNYLAKTSYFDVGAGINYAYFPNENVYIKVGGGVANINQPKESFYGASNQVGMRFTGNIDVLFKASDKFIVNPSVYYTTQTGASELVGGTLLKIYITGEDQNVTDFIIGGYYRLNESAIGAAGFQWGGLQFLCSYDATISSLAPYNGGNGAIEFSLIYQGLYKAFASGGRRTYNCPRFF